jgi:ankyrin repeat protein
MKSASSQQPKRTYKTHGIITPFVDQMPDLYSTETFESEDGSEQGSSFWYAVKHSLYQRFAKLITVENVNQLDPEGFAPIHYAAINNSSLSLDLLIAKGADLKIHASDGHSILELAAKHNSLRVLGVLIARGVNLKERSETFGRTAAHVAAENGNLHFLAQLVDAGCEIDQDDVFGSSIFEYAINSGNLSVFQYIESIFRSKYTDKAIDYQELFKSAILKGADDISCHLIEKGVDYRVRMELGRQPIHIACSNMMKKTIVKFLEKEVDIGAQESNGSSALYYYALSICNEYNVRDYSKPSEPRQASFSANFDLFEIFLEERPELILANNSDGSNAFLVALEFEAYEIAAIMAEYVASINDLGDGESLIVKMAKIGNLTMARYFDLSDVLRRSSEKEIQSAITIAFEKNSKNFMEELIKANCPLSIKILAGSEQVNIAEALAILKKTPRELSSQDTAIISESEISATPSPGPRSLKSASGTKKSSHEKVTMPSLMLSSTESATPFSTHSSHGRFSSEVMEDERALKKARSVL